jgi:predicted NAD/FAD-binding protein
MDQHPPKLFRGKAAWNMETKAKKSTQEERLDYLVEEFKADSAEYKELQTPNSTEDKKTNLKVAYEHPYAKRIVL